MENKGIEMMSLFHTEIIPNYSICMKIPLNCKIRNKMLVTDDTGARP